MPSSNSVCWFWCICVCPGVPGETLHLAIRCPTFLHLKHFLVSWSVQSAAVCPCEEHFAQPCLVANSLTRQCWAHPTFIFFALASLIPGASGTLTIAVLTPFILSRIVISLTVLNSVSNASSVFFNSVASIESSMPISRREMLGDGQFVLAKCSNINDP